MRIEELGGQSVISENLQKSAAAFSCTWPPFQAMGQSKEGWGRSYPAGACLEAKPWPLIGREVAEKRL